MINKLKELHDFAEIIPISATKNDNVDLLINCIKKQLMILLKKQFQQKYILCQAYYFPLYIRCQYMKMGLYILKTPTLLKDLI